MIKGAYDYLYMIKVCSIEMYHQIFIIFVKGFDTQNFT